MMAAELTIGGLYSFHHKRAIYTGKDKGQFCFTVITPAGEMDVRIAQRRLNEIK